MATCEKKLNRNREIAGVKTVGGWEHTDSCFKAQIEKSPMTQFKRSNNVFCVTFFALSLGHVISRLLDLAAQSLTGSPRTLLCFAGKCVCFAYLFLLAGRKRPNSIVV